MSTVVAPDAKTLSDSDRRWLAQMGAALNVSVKPPGGSSMPPAGVSPQTAGGPSGPSPTATPTSEGAKTGEPAPGPSPDDDPKAAEYKKQVLKVGSKGPAVEYLQKKLNATGAKLEVDGKFGPATDKAVREFQKSKSLKVDGIVGEKTWAALDSATPKPEPPKDTKPRMVAFTVTDGETNNAIAGAVVKLGDQSEKTGNTGQATLSLPPGSYPYGVTAEGYGQAIGTFEVKPADQSELRVELKDERKTKTTLTVSPAGKSNRGDKVELTATVQSGSGQNVQSGEVRFDVVFSGGTGGRITLARVPLKNGKAVHTETKLPAGRFLLHANFTPDKLTSKESKADPVEYEVVLGPKGEFEEARKAAIAKFDDAMLNANEHKDLDKQHTELQGIKADMDAAAKASDFTKAKQLADDLSAKSDVYLKKAAELQKKYDKIGADIKKAIDSGNFFSKDNIARKEVAKLSDEEIKHLPPAVRNQLVEELQSGNFSDDDKKAVDKIYNVRALDPAFEKEDKKMRDNLIAELKKDPEMAQARKDWPTMKQEDRVKLMQKIANYQMEAYGTTHVKGQPDLKVVPNNEKPNADGSINMGTYQRRTGVFTLNMNPNNPALKDFDQALDLATHEAGHRYQAFLKQQVEDGKIKPGDPLYNEAIAFKLNDDYYPSHPPSPFDVYQNQPMEAQSRISGASVGAAGIGK